MAIYNHAKNLQNPQSRSWGKCITDKETYGQINRNDFIGFLPQSWGSIMLFGNSRINFGNNKYKKKEYNQHSSVFKGFKKNDP